MAKLRNSGRGHSKAGSLDCESGILPLSCRAPRKTPDIICTVDTRFLHISKVLKAGTIYRGQ